MEIQNNKKLLGLLEKFDQIREILSGEKISLPSIAVIGDQSSGKSSVLQSISGVELPTGTNCVTRCPTILQLRDSENGKEYVEVRIDGDSKSSVESDDLSDTARLIE